ncbi:hybrid sensor histidine kinase/response regulator transcription factor [Hymenobacter canadensis]|uniref:histidine kinase n=1 Tax=Hymenobacter canadensis TaxID=2999067 RepID=A0ABY7LM33_9BACT|nr:substrate-binding domain-containing protein [Hymenobacter canadensis]WBA41507.1 substrate-binding domain-containing protein [Hymenobacter canadensis]
MVGLAVVVKPTRSVGILQLAGAKARWSWLLLLLLLGLVAGCQSAAQEPVYRIGFSQCTTNDAWRRAMLAGMQKELSFHPNVQFQMLDAHNDSDLQRRQVQELIRQRVDLLLISPNQSGPLTELAEAAYNQGIPVVILDRRTTSRLYTAYVGGNNLEVGRTAGHYAAQLLQGRGQVLEVTGTPGSSPAADRDKGFRQALAAHPGLHLAAQVEGNWQPGSVLERLPAVLRAHPETSLIFAHNDPMAQAAYQVVRRLGLEQRIRIIGVDGLAGPGNGLQLVEEGIIQATLLYQTGGEEAIRTALRILRHEPFMKDNVLGTMVIDSSNVTTMRTQTEQLVNQQQDLEGQQRHLREQQRRYANQELTVYLLLASLLGAVVLGALAWRSSRLNRRIRRMVEGQNAEISAQRNQIAELAEDARRSSEAKMRFFTNFSHELRTPLTLILGPVEDMMASPTDLSPAQRHDLALVRRNIQRLMQLVNQLLAFRKIDVGKMAVRAVEGNLVEFVREIMDVFEKTAQKRNITFRFLPAEPVIFLWFDGDILDKVFFNLLSNAFKYTPDGGRIVVSMQQDAAADTVRISVEDNGQGIAEADQPHILEWFYQGQQQSANSSGLGLALAEGLTRLHQGTLSFRSRPGHGTTFDVTLPLTKPASFLEAPVGHILTPLTLDEDAEVPLAAAAPPPDTAAPALPEPTALIIEDHDELRDFLVQKLQPHFRVSTAADGATGLRLAAETIPDVIVCDVNMPELSGLEVATALKGDWRTSHIPLVLLTARSAPEQQVEGVQAGADLYLTKPFNPTFLLESLRTLLRNRDQQREHFRRQLSGATPTVAPQRVDQKFLADLTAIIEGRLDQPDLSVDGIAHSLGVSRTQLYRKVKALLGFGVNEYIQGLRLTKARQLLLQEGSTVAEVAYQTGFSSPSYFSTAFKGKYEVSPTEFKAMHTPMRT